MAKRETGDNMKRIWVRMDESTRKAIAKAAIDLDTTFEKLVGYISAGIAKEMSGDAERIRKYLPRK